YRAAEMLEERRAEFVDALLRAGRASRATAAKEGVAAIDRLVPLAGGSDQIGAVLGAVNPGAAPYFHFSAPPPHRVVGLAAPGGPTLLALVSRAAAAAVSGNCCVAIAPEARPIPALLFGEVIGTSDFPGGVVNILSGKKAELVKALATHRDVDAIDDGSLDPALALLIETEAADRVRRVSRPRATEARHFFEDARLQGLGALEPFLEIQTTW